MTQLTAKTSPAVKAKPIPYGVGSLGLLAVKPVTKSSERTTKLASLQAATTVEALHQSVAAAAIAPRSATGPSTPLDTVALPAAHYGLDQPLLVETPSHPRQFFATSAAEDASSVEPASSVTAARAFVDDLFRRGRVDYKGIGRPEARLEHGPRLFQFRAQRGALSLL